MSNNSNKVIVFGATGAIGTSLIEILREKQPSWNIVAVSRSGAKKDSPLDKISNVENVKGDAEDYEDVERLTKGASMVFCTVGFTTYEAKFWAKYWPIVVDNLLSVTNESRPLVFCDNMYAYGPATNITTSSPIVEPSNKTKPGIRAILREKFQQRMDESPKSIVVVGGADFFGRYVTNLSFLGDTFVGNIVNGKKPIAIGTADAIHDFCFTRDFANALYLASINPGTTYGKFWICPHSIHNKTMREIAIDVNELIDKPVNGVQVLPTSMVYMLSPFMNFMHALKDMLPFWTKDYSIDDSEFCTAFGVEATPMKEALQEYVDVYKSLQAQGR